MPRRILIVVGHPDPAPARFCRALANAYAQSAEAAGHSVRWVDLAKIDVPLLRTMDEFQQGATPDSLKEATQAITWAEHFVFIFPLWLGTMPALLKAFLEQVMRPGTAFAHAVEGEGLDRPLLKGRSARVVVTMGMPAFFYRFWFRSHGLAGLRRSILNLVGISPVRETLFGYVEGVKPAKRAGWIKDMRRLGERGA